jgi:hypothetical protein
MYLFQMPVGSDRRLNFLSPTGPDRHLGLALKKTWSKRAEILKPHLKQSGPGQAQSRTGRTIETPAHLYASLMLPAFHRKCG